MSIPMLRRYFLRTLLFLSCSTVFASEPTCQLLGITQVAGDSRDLSGLTDLLIDKFPHDQFGGISAIEYISSNEYFLLADRGPMDGACEYQCRLHRVAIDFSSADDETTIRLIETTFLCNNDKRIVGAISPASDAMRLDPESIRIDPISKNWWIADEYGPSLLRFNTNGRLLASLQTPAWYQVQTTFTNPDDELRENQKGRQPNGGFESMALTPSGHLVAMLQKPLIQDLRSNDTTSPLASMLRVLKIDLATDQRQEFLYPLDGPNFTTSEILAVDNDRFLVIERDSKPAAKSKLKKIYIFDTSKATDVYSMQSELPDLFLTSNIAAAKKELMIDFLTPESGIPTDKLGAKIEGLCFGPDLPNGKKLLLVVTDNDFVANESTWIYAYAVSLP